MTLALSIILAGVGLILIGAGIEIKSLRQRLEAERRESNWLREQWHKACAELDAAPLKRGPGGRFVKRG